jgi:hypothetical protein
MGVLAGKVEGRLAELTLTLGGVLLADNDLVVDADEREAPMTAGERS